MNPDTVIIHAFGFSITRAQLGGYLRAAIALVAGVGVSKGWWSTDAAASVGVAVAAWSGYTNAPATAPIAPAGLLAVPASTPAPAVKT